MKIPRIAADYTRIYEPAGDHFPGPDEAELKAGEYYAEWVPNDHCFARDDAGRWHAFGITHPLTNLDNVHAGENQSFHALAPEGRLRDVIRADAWKDLPKVLTPAERPGEILANHAPCMIRKDGLYHMIYGPAPLRYAISSDLREWVPQGELHHPPVGRDPNVLVWDGQYHILVCGVDEVTMAASSDLVHCAEHQTILQLPDGLAPESPTLLHYDGTFYLFVCGWDGVWDKKDLVGAYQHITHVYQADDPTHFTVDNEITQLNAHAPEIIQDEDGEWYISSVEWPRRGLSMARLVWE